MKLFSLSVLLLLASLAAQTEVVMVSGTVYDVGKGYFPMDPDRKEADKEDGEHCWLATSSNLIQHWLDAYGDRLDLEDAPPTGTPMCPTPCPAVRVT